MGGSTADVGAGIAVDGSGNVYTTGTFSGTSTFAPTSLSSVNGTADIFVSKLNSAGTSVWAVGMGGGVVAGDQSNAIALDSSGNVYTTGFFNASANFNPAGTFTLFTAGGTDIFVSKLTSTGAFGWAGHMGSSNADQGKAIALDSSGNVYTTGSFSPPTADFDPGSGTYYLSSTGNTNIFVSKLTGPGALAQRLAAGAIGGPATGPLLTQEMLRPIVAEAISHWAAAGLDAEHVRMMQLLDVGITDLPDSYLGLALSNVISIDQDAAGLGWFVAAPADNAAFRAALPGSELVASPGSSAFGKVDLLTVVMHELGHAFGFDESLNADDVMAEFVGTGVRRLPNAADVQLILGQTVDQESPTAPGIMANNFRLGARESFVDSGSQAAPLVGFGGPAPNLGSPKTGHWGGDFLPSDEGTDLHIGRASGRDVLFGDFGADSINAKAASPRTASVRKKTRLNAATKETELEGAWSRDLSAVDEFFAQEPGV